MTDVEIIKVLECCTDNDMDSCEKCPIKIECYTETVDCKKEALDLINRQKAKIKRLQKENNQFADIGKMYSEIKSEAIKEFAERLKERSFSISIFLFDSINKPCIEAVKVNDIDNLVKEMAGDTECL